MDDSCLLGQALKAIYNVMQSTAADFTKCPLPSCHKQSEWQHRIGKKWNGRVNEERDESFITDNQ